MFEGLSNEDREIAGIAAIQRLKGVADIVVSDEVARIEWRSMPYEQQNFVLKLGLGLSEEMVQDIRAQVKANQAIVKAMASAKDFLN